MATYPAPSLSPYTSGTRSLGQKLCELPVNSEAAVQRFYIKMPVLKLWKVFTKTSMMGTGFNTIAKWRPVTLPKEYSTTAPLLGIFRNSQKATLLLESSCFCIWSNLHYLHIIPIHFHLNHSKSHGCFRVNAIS